MPAPEMRDVEIGIQMLFTEWVWGNLNGASGLQGRHDGLKLAYRMHRERASDL